MPYTKLVVGLTGGIGSGKSTVAAFFSDLGVDIIDTDILARVLTQPQQPAYDTICKKFGAEILLPDGQLDRKALRKIIFNDAEQRIWLEKILHPLIRTETERLTKQSQSAYCIVVIPLLFESEPNPTINRILVVDAPEATQLRRAATRDDLSIEEVADIIKTQATREQRLAGADDIIFNDDGVGHILPQVKKLHEFYLSVTRES